MYTRGAVSIKGVVTKTKVIVVVNTGVVVDKGESVVNIKDRGRFKLWFY